MISDQELIKIFTPAFFTIVGVVVGSMLSYRNSYKLYKKQKMYENRRISYSKLLANKMPWTQSINTHLEAKFLSEFYDARYLILAEENDFQESRRQFDRALILIKDMIIFQKEIFEVLGVVQTCYKVDNELQKAIDDIYNITIINVRPFPRSIKSIDELNDFYSVESQKITPLVNTEYEAKVCKLLDILKERLRNEK